MKRTGKEGFTLVEIIAVLVILGVLAAIAIPKYIDMQNSAETKAIDAGIAELNGRESLTWGKEKLDTGWTDDATTFGKVDTNLGEDYSWAAAPTVGGGTLEFRGASVALSRDASMDTQPGRWKKAPAGP